MAAQSVSPTTVTLCGPISSLHNGSILITRMALHVCRASAVCSTEGQNLDACLIGRGAVPHDDLVGGRPDHESCSVDFLAVCSTRSQSLWRTPTH